MSKYTRFDANCMGRHLCGLLGSGATFRVYGQDTDKFDRGPVVVATSGNGRIGVRSPRPDRFVARFTGAKVGITTECIDADGKTPIEALKELRSELAYRQQCLAEGLSVYGVSDE